jgi:serine/threonine protein kinase HipA of HipAB toxin-antitoxin module
MPTRREIYVYDIERDTVTPLDVTGLNAQEVRDLRKILEMQDHIYTQASDPRLRTIKAVLRKYHHVITEASGEGGNYPYIDAIDEDMELDIIERHTDDWDSEDRKILTEQLYARIYGEVE